MISKTVCELRALATLVLFSGISLGLSGECSARDAVVTVEWMHECEGQFYVHPIFVDVAAEPGDEIIVTSGGDRAVTCLTARGDVLWSYDMFDWRLTATPAVGDIDGDREIEIVIGGTDQSLTCLGGDGNVEWKERLDGKIAWSGVAIADLEGVGSASVITGTDQGDVLVYDGRGQLRWRKKLQAGIAKPIAAADLDGDGKRELVVTCGHRWYCLSSAGEILWQRIGGEAGASPIAVNLDGEPGKEILLYTMDGLLLCLSGADGAPIWTYSTAGRVKTTGTGIALADLDADGTIEIVFGDDQGFVYILNAGGDEKRVWRTGVRAESCATIGDVDGNGTLDILMSSMDGNLRCYTASGYLMWLFPTQRRLQAPPTLGDPDRDGVTEIVLATGDGDVLCLSCDGKYDPAKMAWPSRHFDAAQTGDLR